MQNRHGRKVPSQGSKSETGANAQQRQLQQQLDRFNAPWHGLVQRPENNNWWVNAEDIQDEDLFRFVETYFKLFVDFYDYALFSSPRRFILNVFACLDYLCSK